MVQHLISLGADVNKKSHRRGISPLFMASFSAPVEIARYLLEKGADVHEKNHDGLSLLHTATLNENPDMINLLIHHTIPINGQTNRGNTALHLAIENDKAQAAQRLIDLGIDTEIKNGAQKTALDCALDMESDAMANLLLGACDQKKLPAQPQKSRPKLDKKTGVKKSPHPNNPLFDAILQGDRKKIDALIEQGLDIKNCKNPLFPTPLHCVICSDYPELVRYFVEKGCDINYVDENGATLLHLAACMGHISMLNALVISGANIDQQNTFHNSALFEALHTGALEAAEFLMIVGARCTVPKCTTSAFEIALEHDKKAGTPTYATFICNALRKKRISGLTEIFMLRPNKENPQRLPSSEIVTTETHGKIAHCPTLDYYRYAELNRDYYSWVQH
jgi:ankyrin repeat protein